MNKLTPFRNLLLGLLLCAVAPAASFAQISVGVSIRIAPPALPVFVQPPCPTPGYLWTPGYWAYGPEGFYWVPGVWIAPPRSGVLWTPGYWGHAGGLYVWHPGYWGSHVGFYGGVHYGVGYTGVGFVGGVWAANVFRYNTAVVNVNRTVIHNTYVDGTVIRNTYVNNRASFNGPGGVRAQPTPMDRQALHEQHFQPTTNQVAHREMAAQNRNQFASVNGGRPATVAMNRVNGRRYNQQGRIAEGVASGQLTPHETQRLEGQQVRTNREIRADRQANGGRLTPEERQHVNRQQNRESRHIEKEKHDAQHEPR